MLPNRKKRVLNPLISLKNGGRGGIRTHGTLAGTPVFKTGALNRSATLPSQRHQSLGVIKIKNSMATGPNLDPSGFMSKEAGCQRPIIAETGLSAVSFRFDRGR
jgi:hypothetical protein